MSYLDLQSTPGVATFTVPRVDDGHSPPIDIPLGFPMGNDRLFEVFVSTKARMIHTISSLWSLKSYLRSVCLYLKIAQPSRDSDNDTVPGNPSFSY